MAKLRRMGKRIIEGYERTGKIRAARQLALMGYHNEAKFLLETL